MKSGLRSFLFAFKQKSRKPEENRRIDTVKGINSRVIIVSSKLPPIFKEAIFVINDKYDTGSGNIMEQADEALNEYSKGAGLTTKKTSPVCDEACFFGGDEGS